MSSTVRQGIILAAGRGTRLQPLSNLIPKPLRPVCNKPIMQYQIEAMRDANICDIAIVIGPSGDAIRACFSDGSALGVQLSYIEDEAPAGIAASLACAEPWVRGPFALFLGDIFLSLEDLAPALDPMAHGAAGTIIVRHDMPAAVQRNFAVLTEGDGRITQVIEKPRHPPTNLKGCGVYVFDQSIFEAIRRTPRSALRNEYELTDAIQIMIDFGRPLFAANVVRWDMNITFPADLLACNLRVLRERHGLSLVGLRTRLDTGVQLVESIVGDDATIDAPVRLEECLVLPGARVHTVGGTQRRAIFGDGIHLEQELGARG
jgi:dTDP-glucose pyrophosphorylase